MELLLGAPLPAILTNIRLGWKGLPVTNILAIYEKIVNYGGKKFYNIVAWSLRSVVADASANKVITGARFVKKDRVVHIEIEEATALPEGKSGTTINRNYDLEILLKIRKDCFQVTSKFIADH